MSLHAVSSNKVHCCLVALILFILIFLSLAYLLTYLDNTRFHERENSMNDETTNRISGGVSIKAPCIRKQVPKNDSDIVVNRLNDTSLMSQFLSAFNILPKPPSDNFIIIEEIYNNNNNNSKPTINYCNESQESQITNHSPSNESLQCPVGLFACKTTPEICIEQRHNCDGKADCPNGSDENGCHDSNGAMEKMFSEMIKTANMTAENLDYEPAEMTPEMELIYREKYFVPKNCTVKQFLKDLCPCDLNDPLVVICANASLEIIPSNTTRSSVRKMKFNHNFIKTIDDVVWPEPLTNLVLVYNRLTNIKARAFKSAPNLGQLYLTHNEISEMDIEALDGLTSLYRLSIESNKLKTFNTQMLLNTPELRYIDLSYNTIELPDETDFSVCCRHLKEIILDYNKITRIRSYWFSDLPNLHWVSLIYNEISTIDSGSFDGNLQLTQLDLAFNKIKVINRQMFANNLNIHLLDLTGNQLDPLPIDAFDEIIHLRTLNLTYVEFESIQSGTFSKLRELEFIYFAKFHYCHYASHVRVCRPSTDGISSIEGLLAFSTLKYAVWIVAFVCIVGNILVILWRSISSHEDKTLSLFVKNLSIADLMMGVYLCVIGWQDWKFQDKFSSHAIEWMSSWTCTAIGFLAILSSESSVFILTIITIERFRCIISISNFQQDAQERLARVYVILAWLASFLIALFPLIKRVSINSDYYATNGLCLPLHIDQPYTSGWLYSAFIYLGINFLAVLIMIGLYAKMYTMIIDGRQTSRPVLLRSEKREDAILAIRLFFIVITDCFCWIPIVVIKMMALLKFNISASIYGWLVVFIIPINSALNPILYTLAAPTSLRAAVCRLFERLCYRIDSITVSSARGSNYSSQSSSTGSAHLDSTQQVIINGGTGESRRRNTGSVSTNTCDTFDVSIVSQPKGSVESAMVHLRNSPPNATNPKSHHRPVTEAATTKLFSSFTTIAIDKDGKFNSEINGKVCDQYHMSGVAGKTINKQTPYQARQPFDCLLGYADDDDDISSEPEVMSHKTSTNNNAVSERKQLVATISYSSAAGGKSKIVHDFVERRKSFDGGRLPIDDTSDGAKQIATDSPTCEYHISHKQVQPSKMTNHSSLLSGVAGNYEIELDGNRTLIPAYKKRSPETQKDKLFRGEISDDDQSKVDAAPTMGSQRRRLSVRSRESDDGSSSQTGLD